MQLRRIESKLNYFYKLKVTYHAAWGHSSNTIKGCSLKACNVAFLEVSNVSRCDCNVHRGTTCHVLLVCPFYYFSLFATDGSTVILFSDEYDELRW